MAPKAKAAAAEPLAAREVALTTAAVVSVYGGALYALHHWAAEPAFPMVAAAASEKFGFWGTLPSAAEPAFPMVAAAASEKFGFWGTLPSAWDHPEPNYVVSGVVGEFWSVLTTIPVAGALLLYEGLRFGYGAKVMFIFVMTCCMYSMAFAAHLTLQKLIFSTTVVAVMSNALLTFAMFSHVLHSSLQSKLVRGSVVLLSEILLVGTVATLPYALEAHGGVWTLFTVQSPGVFLATFLAGGMAWTATRREEKDTYRLVCTSGSLLSTAMVLSLIECLVGFESGYLENFWGFPWLHIAIHVLEQVGIYVFGVGVAALQALLICPEAFEGAEVRTVAGCIVYLYCPQPQSEPLLSKRRASTGSPTGRGRSPAATAVGSPRSANANAPQPAAVAAAPETALQRRKRTQSPGVASLVAPKARTVASALN